MEAKILKPITALTAEFTVSLGNYPVDSNETISRMYQTAMQNGLSILGPLYWNHLECDGQRGTPYRLQIALPVASNTDYKGEFPLVTLPGIQYTDTFHYGPLDKFGETYGKFIGDILEAGWKPTNNFRELYLNYDVADPSNHLVYIMAEVAR